MWKKENEDKVGKVNYKVFLPYFLILLTCLILIQFQIQTRAVMVYNDTVFHFNRIQALANQITSGNFSYFQMFPTGRIINAMYGPFFSYLNALVLIISGTYFRFQIISDFAIYLIAGIGMYRLALKAKVDPKISIVLSLLFLNIGNIPYWINGSSGMSWGEAFIPFVFIEAVNMIQNHDRPVRWVHLAVALGLLTQVHMLSTLLTIVALTPLALVGFVLAKNKGKMIIDLLKAIGLYLLLIANYWGSFLVLYSKNKIATPVPGDLQRAVYLSNFGDAGTKVDIFLVALIVFQLIYVLLHFKKNILNTSVTLIGFIFFFSSTKLFPWGWVSNHFPILKTTFQMPHRLLIVAYPLLMLGVGITTMMLMSSSRKSARVMQFWIVLTFIQAFIPNVITNYQTSQNYLNKNSVVVPAWYYRVTPNRAAIQDALHSRNRDTFLKLVVNNEPDYLPMKKKVDYVETERLFARNVLDRQNNFQTKLGKHGSIELTWQSKKNKSETLPVVMYTQSELTVNNKRINKPNWNAIGVPTVQAKKGLNHAVLYFRQPVYFTVLLTISIISWLVVIAGSIYKKVRDSKKNLATA